MSGIYRIPVPGFPVTAPEDNMVSLLFGGDFCPVGCYENKLLRGENVFSPVLAKLFSQSDIAMVNLEAPLCSPETTSLSLNGFGLRGAPAVAETLRKMNIHAAGIGNNHIRDFGDSGVFQTMAALDRAGIAHAGAGANRFEAEKPLVMTRNGLSVGVLVLAEAELNAATEHVPGSSDFAPECQSQLVSEWHDKVDFLIVFLHAGHEFTTVPSLRMLRGCRLLAEAGADAVICHHPHVIQGVERHRQSFIAYSIGNLVFDTPYVNRFPESRESFLVRLTVARPHEIHSLSLIPCRMTEDSQVRPLEQDEATRFERRIAELSSLLKHGYEQEWERNVAKRYEEEYHTLLQKFSGNFFDRENRDFALRTWNLFTCPTHLEMIREICRMFGEGKLKRHVH